MNKRKFSYTLDDGFLEDGQKIGIWEILLYLNNMNALLREVKLELASLNKYKAFNTYSGGMGKYEVLSDDVIDLNFNDLVKKIDEVISDE